MFTISENSINTSSSVVLTERVECGVESPISSVIELELLIVISKGDMKKCVEDMKCDLLAFLEFILSSFGYRILDYHRFNDLTIKNNESITRRHWCYEYQVLQVENNYVECQLKASRRVQNFRSSWRLVYTAHKEHPNWNHGRRDSSRFLTCC